MDRPAVTGDQLAGQWERVLSERIPPSDKSHVQADEADEQAVLIHIATEGRSSYSFDFKCTYKDSREVKVDLLDVERDGVHIEGTQDHVQEMIDDYVRHIHETAQALHDITHHGEGVMTRG